MSRAPRFAHASEAELARILDFYRVAWEYEPRTFPLAWDMDGTATECFTPDFYLPEEDLYVELTTLRQPLARRKHRKVRLLRELYPMVRVKLLNARDFRELLARYGRADVAAAIIGPEGQVGILPPVRPVAPRPAPALDPDPIVRSPAA